MGERVINSLRVRCSEVRTMIAKDRHLRNDYHISNQDTSCTLLVDDLIQLDNSFLDLKFGLD